MRTGKQTERCACAARLERLSYRLHLSRLESGLLLRRPGQPALGRQQNEEEFCAHKAPSTAPTPKKGLQQTTKMRQPTEDWIGEVKVAGLT